MLILHLISFGNGLVLMQKEDRRAFKKGVYNQMDAGRSRSGLAGGIAYKLHKKHNSLTERSGKFFMYQKITHLACGRLFVQLC